jgi:hypothetical protein
VILERLRPSVIRLKRRRFEVAVAVLFPLVVALWGATILARLGASGAPPACIEKAQATIGAVDETCLGPMRAWAALMTAEGDKFMAVMAVLPFFVGLLAGGPIVARECEERSAQTTWWLHPSRRRWLLAEIGPVLALVLPAAGIAAAVATQLADLRALWGLPSAPEMALHGPLVLARALAGVGAGLLLGALSQRVVPGLVLGGLVCWGLAVGVGPLQERWLSGHEPVPLAEGSAGVVTGWSWVAPDGTILSDEAALALVPEAVSRLDAGDPQAPHSGAWLTERGYHLAPMGVPDGVAAGWALYEGALYVGFGLLSLGAAVVFVDRIRPR